MPGLGHDDMTVNDAMTLDSVFLFSVMLLPTLSGGITWNAVMSCPGRYWNAFN